jgi:bifunctional UDP-N-acetylglucosamine pyrophosphorylase/glucosamine-1-phosphate N-acetyltransferase
MRSPLAKVLHPVLGRPMLAQLLESLRACGADRTVVVVGHQAETVGALVQSLGAETVLQTPQRGTGHALICCREALAAGAPGELLLVTGDAPLLPAEKIERLWSEFEASGSAAGVVSLDLPDPFGYGRILRDQRGRLARIVEERDATPGERAVTEVNSGVYFLKTPSVFDSLSSTGTENAQGEVYLTDLFAKMSEQGAPALLMRAEDPSMWLGINSQAELARATRSLRLQVLNQWMARGVVVDDPETTWVESSVRIEAGVRLHPFVRLCGNTLLGEGVEVRAFSCLQDVQLGPGTLVKEHCVLEGTITGDSCILGPFCRTREGTELSNRVHLGNFVETKKAVLREGVKANHLSYLGDATVGEGSNIGAGTITCNYDGVHKHPTVLGARVFVGSDTQLVAPVTVGDGAYIGAGTTVTKSIPAGALAISRAPQRNIEGWAARKKESTHRRANEPTKP